MGLLKKIVAIFTAVVVSVGVLSISAFADPFEDAVAISSGEEVTGKVDKNGGVTYELTSKWTGSLIVNWSVGLQWSYLHVYDADGAYLKVNSLNVKAGELREGGEGKDKVRGFWNTISERFSASATYSIGKGTYYITVTNGNGSYGDGDGSLRLSVEFPNKTSTDLTYLGITMKKGDTMKLESVGVSSGNVKWTSSKKAVVSVTSKGVITAKKKGTSVISCTYNDKTVKLKVTVK